MIQVVKITRTSCKESYFSQHHDNYCRRCNGDTLDRERSRTSASITITTVADATALRVGG